MSSGVARSNRTLLLVGVLVLCVWTLLPIYLLALGALGGRDIVSQWPKPFAPFGISFETLRTFLAIEGVWRATWVSIKAAAMTMVMALALGVPAGYALARFRFRGAGAYRVLILMTRAFPVAILALPLTVSFIRLGVYDTPFGVALVHAVLATPFATLVCASLFMGIPRELEEAAWVFGCSRFTGFLRVVLPLALPGIAAASIFAFVLSWNEVFAASVLTVRQRTLTAYLLSVLSESPLHLQFAGGLILIVPSVLFIFLVRRRLFAMWGIGNR
ncbi:carbohydrate ABC transporter permease [Bosea sp. AS-1]|jgi:multiple sugar transport system permease protein|uniref:carbohydrate ABC transporter permease n=1 Tax=Bosea sp. AS-1 TaxID=2015316 RepID=UPI000B798C03|nr:carbohydrate ABC transporter permease [Bosea sp. AS-1]